MDYHWYDFIGNIGVVLILITYLLLQIEKLKSSSFWYSLWNSVGAIMILISLFYSFNLSAFIIEIFWLLISIYGIVKSFRKKL